MDDPFIKPMNKDRNFKSFFFRYFVNPPLIYSPPLEMEKTQESNPAPRWHKSTILASPLFSRDQLRRNYRGQKIQFSFSDLLTRAFILTYGIQGFDHCNNEIVYADNGDKSRIVKQDLQKKDFSTWMLIASFFGLPTRLRIVKDETPELGIVQLLRNFIGGWEPLFMVDPNHPEQKKMNWNEKQIWQWVLLFLIKVPLLIPLNILLVIVKIPLNILKLFSEWIPIILTNLLSVWFLNMNAQMRYVASKQHRSILQKGGKLLFMGIWTGILGIFNYTSRIIMILGRAATSPEKSARMAYAAGYELKIQGIPLEESEVFSKIFGILGATLSVMLSMAIWTLALPLALGAFTTYLPVYFPQVYQYLSTITQLPIVSQSLAILSSTFEPLGTLLIAYTGTALSTMATFVGVQIPTLCLILGSALGAFAALIGTIVNRLVDEFSRAWTGWFGAGNGPVTTLMAWYQRQMKPKRQQLIEQENTILQSSHIAVEVAPGIKTWSLLLPENHPAKKLAQKTGTEISFIDWATQLEASHPYKQLANQMKEDLKLAEHVAARLNSQTHEPDTILKTSPAIPAERCAMTSKSIPLF